MSRLRLTPPCKCVRAVVRGERVILAVDRELALGDAVGDAAGGAAEVAVGGRFVAGDVVEAEHDVGHLPFLSGTCHSVSVAPREISLTIAPSTLVSVNSSTGVPSAVLPKSLTFTSARQSRHRRERSPNTRKFAVNSVTECWQTSIRQIPRTNNRMMQRLRLMVPTETESCRRRDHRRLAHREPRLYLPGGGFPPVADQERSRHCRRIYAALVNQE